MSEMVTDQLVDELLTLWRVLRQASHPVRRGEMTPEQYWLLRVLNRRGPMSIGELGEALGITPSSVTTACKRLQKVGMVQRERQAEDERVVHVALTASGRERVEDWHQRRRTVLADLVKVLAPPEQDLLRQLIARVLAASEAHETEGRGE